MRSISMTKIVSAVLALTVIAGAVTPSAAFDSKKFWEMHPAKSGS